MLRPLFAALLLGLALAFAPTAKAAEAGWSYSPDSWDFGEVVTGTTSPAKTFTLTNTGEVTLRVVFISLESSEGARFERAADSCRGALLAPGADCETSITFNPSTFGPKDGKLRVYSEGGLATPATVELRGHGAGPIVSITPEELLFERLVVGEVSAPRAFTIHNDGLASLDISSLEIFPGEGPEGPLTPQFQIAGGTCEAGGVVSPGASCTVDVIFAPTRVQGTTTFLEIVDNAPGSPHEVYMTGIGDSQPSPRPIPPRFPPEPRAYIKAHPKRLTTARNAVFRLRGSPTATRFACKLDHHRLKTCGAYVRYHRLRRGRHRFVVRAFAAGDGLWGPRITYRWRIRR
jgi:hypothetical protein